MKNLTEWINIHNKWSNFSASEIKKHHNKLINPRLLGNNIERARFIKNFIYLLPIGIKGFVLFFIKYFLLLGFLDGRLGFIYCFLNSFWFSTLIDAKKFEIKLSKRHI